MDVCVGISLIPKKNTPNGHITNIKENVLVYVSSVSAVTIITIVKRQ